MSRRWVLLGAVAGLVLSACTANQSERSAAVPAVLEAVGGSAREDVPSALDRIDDPALPPPLVDPTRVISGGPPPDGIPPIDEPRFEPAAGVDWLTDDDANPDGFVDAETGSRWNVLGQAVEGPLTGAALTPVEHLDTFWFAWASVHPASRIVGSG